jgi:arylsulfatase A
MLHQSVCIVPACAADESAKRPPNIVIILIDDLGWLDLGCFGSTFYETPHIDKLASQGMKFTDAYASCSVCSPTRASLLTGRYPARLHLTDYLTGRPPKDAKLQVPEWRPYLLPSTQTIATALKPAGYVSALVGKWHLGGSREFGAPAAAEASTPERFGFDVNVAGSHFGQPPDYFAPYERGGPKNTTHRFPNFSSKVEGEYLTERLTDEAEKFIENNKDRPFFLYFPHYAVHTSMGNRWQAKPKTIEKYKAKANPKAPQHHAVYAAMIEDMDESIGRVLRKLDQLKLSEKTIVIFTSDNGGYGQATAQPPLRGAKSEAYEGGIRVPLIVRWPGAIAPGSRCEVPVISADFLPTCCEVAGVKPAANQPVDGVSLVPLLKQTGTLTRDALFWHYPHYNDLSKPHGIIRQGDWKLIEFYEDSRHELYNLKNDIGEKVDLAKSEGEKAKELQRALADWRRQVGAQMPVAKVAPK